MKTDITLILGNYNYAECLYETVQAVMAQKVRPDEIIITDDCSTDHSREVIERLAAEIPLIRPIFNETNVGCNPSVNIALQQAKGKYVSAFGIDDPLCNSNFFSNLIPLINKHPEAGFYFGEHIVEYRGPGVYLSRPEVVKLAPSPRYFSPTEFSDIYSSRTELSIPTVPSLWPREALLSIGGLLPSLGWMGDWFAALVLCFRGGACYMPGVYQSIRYSPSSMSREGMRARQDYRAKVVTLLDTLNLPQFADVPTLANPDQVTLLEEDRISAYYAGGTLYAEPSRLGPLI